MNYSRLQSIFVFGLVVVLTACVNQGVKNKASLEIFKQSISGEWRSASGDGLVIVPVRARMVTDEAVYVEHTSANGTVSGRLLDLLSTPDGKKVLQRALVFTQDGQWRNLRETPELFTALLPKDVRPAGSCDIQPSDDRNTVSYSCAGSPPQVFARRP
jgi:hypothetical protein